MRVLQLVEKAKRKQLSSKIWFDQRAGHVTPSHYTTHKLVQAIFAPCKM